MRPNRADYQWGEDPLEQLMVRFDSWRAIGSGNRAGRSLATKSTQGGRAILQAVTRVKLEQAPKAAMWTPTRHKIGEGRTDREDNHCAPIWSAGVVSTACEKGSQDQSGRPGMVAGSRPANAAGRDGGPSGRRRGARYRGTWVMPGEGRPLASGVLVKEGRSGDWR